MAVETMNIRGIPEAKGLVNVTRVVFESLSQEAQFQLFLAATADNWPINKAAAEEAGSLIESSQDAGDEKVIVSFHSSIKNIICWLCGA